MSKYLLINEFGTASCTVEFEPIDGEDSFLNVNYNLTSMKVDCTDWKELQRIVEKCDTWKEELYFVATHVSGNWGIHIVNPDGNGAGVLFECWDDDGPTIDLGTLAECYGDCDVCDRYCYSFKNMSPYENKCDCPNYHRCADCYGTTYDEHGDEEDFDPLWDFRCQCTKINGREDLSRAIIARNPLY